jgi:fermentation-respiration switch protein FrsA (DUF1100 family)
MLFFEHSLIYPAPQHPRGNWEPTQLAYDDIHFQSADGTKLHGWYIEHPEPQAQVVYFHGNGTHVPDLAPLLRELSTRYRLSIFAFDYRGYGRSEGSPNEAGVLADSEAAVQWLADRTGLATDQLVMHGRSLGGAAASDMAAKHGARGRIIEDTFTSMPDVAAPLYWWAPIRLLMRTQYNSEEKIRRYRGLLLHGHGSQDSLVPVALAHRLHAAAEQADKTFVEMAGKGHNQPPTSEFYRAMEKFYQKLPAQEKS